MLMKEAVGEAFGYCWRGRGANDSVSIANVIEQCKQHCMEKQSSTVSIILDFIIDCLSYLYVMWSQTCNCDVKCQFYCNRKISAHSHAMESFTEMLFKQAVIHYRQWYSETVQLWGHVYIHRLPRCHLLLRMEGSWDIGVIFRLDARQMTLSIGWSCDLVVSGSHFCSFTAIMSIS